jgi:hypothetical protein
MSFPLLQVLADPRTVAIFLSELVESQIFIPKSPEIVKMKECFWIFRKFSIESDRQP